MADQYQGSGLLPSVTDAPPAVYTPQEARAIDRQARASEQVGAAQQSSAELDRQAAQAAVMAKVEAAKRADAQRRGDPTYGAQEMQQGGQASFGQAFEALGAPGTVSRSPRPFYRETKQYNERMAGTAQQPGLVDEVVPLAQQTQQAELEQNRIAAESMEEMADRQLKAMTMLRANQQAAAERGTAQLQRQQKVNDLALAAADDLAKTADTDPGKGWADAPLWSKFFAVIGAGLMGWAGNSDPTAMIRSVTEQSIRTQEAALAKKQARVGNLQNQAGLESSLYEKIQADSASKMEGDLVYTKAILMHAQQQAMARLQRAGVQTLNAQQQQFLNSLQQEVAGIDLELGKQAAANTPTVTTMRPAYNSDQRGLLREAGKQGLRDASAGQAAVVDSAQKREASAAKLAEAEVQHGPGSLEERKFQREQRKDVAGGEKGAAVETALRLTQDYLKDYGEDIPGRTEGGVGGEAYFSEPNWWRSEEGKREVNRRALLSHWYATALTGANVSESQEQFLSDLVRDPKMSGDQIRVGLADLQRSLELYQQTSQRIAEPEAEAEYRGIAADMMPAREQKTGGRTRSNTGVQSEAEALGGKLR